MVSCTLIAITTVIGVSIWEWINDRKYIMLACRILNCTDRDRREGHVGWDIVLIVIAGIVIGLCLAIWKVTIPITAIIGGAYYARYYIRQKKKEA